MLENWLIIFLPFFDTYIVNIANFIRQGYSLGIKYLPFYINASKLKRN